MNYYKILNVSTNANDKDIKKAYRLLAKKYHPDMYQGDKSYAENKMQEINEAYATLSDRSLREEYDESIGLNKTSEIKENTYDFNKRKNTDSYSNNIKNYNIKYKPNNANTYYDNYGYAETNYTAYTGERYTRNRYEEKINIDVKSTAIKIGILLVVAGIILFSLMGSIIKSFSQLKNINTSNTTSRNYSVSDQNINYNKNPTTVNKKPASQNSTAVNKKSNTQESSNVNNNSINVEISREDINKAIDEELEKYDIDKEEVKKQLNNILELIEEYNKNATN